MATVVRGNDFGAELGALLQGISMFQERSLHNQYNRKMMELLSGTESQKEAGVKIPASGQTDWTPDLSRKQIDMLKTYPVEDQKAMYENFMANKAEENIGKSQSSYRPMNEDELYDLYLGASMKADTIGTAYPRQMRENPYENVLGRLGGGEERQFAPKAAKVFEDLKGNVYDANTPEGFAGIQRSAKMGWKPKPVASQDLMAQRMFEEDRFLGDEEEIKAIDVQRKKQVLTPEQRKDLVLSERFKLLDKIEATSGTEKKLIENAKRRMKNLKVSNWDKLSKEDNEKLGAIHIETRNQILKLRLEK